MSRKKPGLGRSQEHASAQALLTPWQKFYQQVRDPSWPDCDLESDFTGLPEWIQRECQEHGYRPGEFGDQSPLVSRPFPIDTATACQLKWNWSTLYLSDETTASCHRTRHHAFDVDSFEFHNTPEKLEDRERMLDGQWPRRGCEYCQNIEAAGGASDRITNLDLEGMHAPPELEDDPRATVVTPRILEIYFSNTCNLKCVYCGEWFSSLWAAENQKHGRFQKDGLVIESGLYRVDEQRQAHTRRRLWQWMEQHGANLTNFNVLGGEPLYQRELDECLDFFERVPAPNIDFQIFTNLNCRPRRLESVINRVRAIIDRGHLRRFTVTASIDCWGREQEYVRFPLDLDSWTSNFEQLLKHEWINIVVGSTVTPLTAKTLPDLIERLNRWRGQHAIHHYLNSVNNPSYLFIDILGDFFQDDFDRALDLMPAQTPEQIKVRDYLRGIAVQSASGGVNPEQAQRLWDFLEEMDRRRNINWRRSFPWLQQPLQQAVDQKTKKPYNKVFQIRRLSQ
jgi:pyruvate-formate lyase-activating enzyme